MTGTRDKKGNSRAKFPPLTSLYLYISGICNLACRHCWIEPEYARKGKPVEWLPLDKIVAAIREMIPLGLQGVKISGGEPLLYPKFRELLTSIRGLNLGITLETNGLLLDADCARFLKETRVGHVAVSLDSDRPEGHNLFRGVPGSFERSLAGLKNLVAERLPTQVIIALWRGNAERLPEIVRWAASFGVRSIKVNPVNSLGRGGGLAAQGELLGVEEVLDCFHRIRQLRKQLSAKIHFDVPIAFHSLEEIRGRVTGSCGIQNILGLLPNGRFSMCGIGLGCDELSFGKLGESDIARLWREAPLLRRIRREIPTRLEGTCGHCLFRTRCLGKCRAEAHALTGRLSAPFDFCRRAQELGLLPASRLVPERTPGRKVSGGKREIAAGEGRGTISIPREEL